ncbi:AAA family ATPase [Spirillospora sp. CA-294931]|uniref:AAA family ATPase n=1 Tax=Spirillospora sp. CA-294931 TaxID=3240042 RepID=UPI003D93A58D
MLARSVSLVLRLARIEAGAGGAAEVGGGHLIMGLTRLCRPDLSDLIDGRGMDADERRELERDAEELRRRFTGAGVDPDALRRRLRRRLDGVEPRPAGHELTSALTRAQAHARDGRVRAADLLRALLEAADDRVRAVFARCGAADPLAAFFPEAAPSPRPTPHLDRYGRDLTRLAGEGALPPLVGRRAELRSLARVLVRQRKANAVLVGDAGVGKTGIVEGLAQRLAAPGAPADLAGARVVELSMTALLAGAAYRGDFEKRLQAVLAEARENPELILFVDEVHTVLGAGGRGAGDAANILKPALARGELRCVGATTPGEYARTIETDPALERRFEVIWVDEPTRAEALEILDGLRERLADHHGVEIGADAPAAAVDLAIRHLPGLRLPDKAIDLIDQACAAARIPTLSPGENPAGPGRVGRAEIAAVVAARARLPVERVEASQARRLRGMEEHLRRRVVGQDEAVAAVAEAVRTARAGLGDPRRPIGVFLFAGPTGTGKTELAKALAEFLFDDERRLVRVDMSEYKERHSVSRLLGAPPGYLGHDREGQLSGPMRAHPHSVVLFDEVEKAHPEVLDLFLQIFDEGRLTDSRGRRVSFTDAVVILTSNLGAAPPAASGGGPFGFAPAAAPPAASGRVMDALRATLRPELLGRIGRVVVFDPLSPDALHRIVDALAARLQDRLADRAITLALTGGARELLIRAGSDARSGARALEHAFDRLLVQPLGRALLDERFGDGVTVLVEAEGEALAFTPSYRQDETTTERLEGTTR